MKVWAGETEDRSPVTRAFIKLFLRHGAGLVMSELGLR